jgi:NAD(P) transhydrogenase subunit beta
MNENFGLGPFILEMAYLLSASGFFLSLKMLSSPKTARAGNLLAALSMFLAVLITFIYARPENLGPILAAIALGSLAGAYAAYKVEMTAMPQMVAVFNGLGGLASVLVAFAEGFRLAEENLFHVDPLFIIASWFSVVVGAITLSGSIVAYLKLQELIPTRPMLFLGQRFLTIALCFFTLGLLLLMFAEPKSPDIIVALALLSIILGVLLVLPIGGADMPVVISLLNSYSGLAALFAGFVVKSNILIISGALVGASGIILTRLMCQAMNRSLLHVVFGAFGGVNISSAAGEEKPMKEFLPIDAAMLLSNAQKVIIVPGYGLAVSQAQRNLREIADALKAQGIDIAYAIHPVAGRMPGHMNVLLAEADVPYQELYDIDQINGEFESADVAIIIGANDVVNPSARSDKSSPLFGMPILNADKAKSVIVMKRGRGRGFAGVENPLFTLDNAGVVFGDAKQSLIKLLAALKDL